MKLNILPLLLGGYSLFSSYVIRVNADVNVPSDLSKGRQSFSQTARVELHDNNPIKTVAPGSRILKRAKKSWTAGEEQRLLELKGQGMSWLEIVKQFPERSYSALQSRYYLLTLDPNRIKRRRRAWTERDKALLSELVEKDTPWEEIAKRFPGRSISALRDQYRYLIEDRQVPQDTLQRWTTEEKKLLIKLREQGVPWKEKPAYFENRSLIALQQQYRKITTPKQPRQGAFTPEEDNLIVKSLESGKIVTDISKLIGRETRGIKRRIRKLDQLGRIKSVPQLVKGRQYTEGELELMQLLREDTNMTWTEIAAKHFPGRSYANIKSAYANYRKQKDEKGENM